MSSIRMQRSVIMPLVMANVVVFVLQMIFGEGFTNLFLVAKGDLFVRPWTMITSMFLHSPYGMTHIFFNMYALFIFGPLLESRIGPKRFLLLYFVAGIGASIISSFVYDAALGASGAVMGVIGTLIILMPNLRLLLFFVIPMPLWMAGLVFGIIDLFGIIPGVAGAAHLAGMITGLLFGLVFKQKGKKFSKKFKKATHMTSQEVEEFLRNGKI